MGELIRSNRSEPFGILLVKRFLCYFFVLYYFLVYLERRPNYSSRLTAPAVVQTNRVKRVWYNSETLLKGSLVVCEDAYAQMSPHETPVASPTYRVLDKQQLHNFLPKGINMVRKRVRL